MVATTARTTPTRPTGESTCRWCGVDAPMSGSRQRPPSDYRQLRRETERRQLYAVIAVLVLLGGGLIALIWGPGAAITGVACLILGAGLIVGLWLLLTVIERWTED